MTTVVKNAGWLLSVAATAANVRAVGDGVTVPGNPWFTYHACDGWELAKGMHDSYDLSPVWPPVPDWSTWDGESNVAAFLNAIDSYPGWFPTSGDESIPGYASRKANELSGNNEYFTCIVADWMLPFVSGALFTSVRRLALIPPIWPGIELVALGTPVALADGFTIAEPMNGVLVEITGTPPGMGAYDFDGTPSYKYCGGIAFTNDDGWNEQAQPFGFVKHIICPKACVLAAAAVGRAASGLVGTATPWTYLTL